VTVLLAASSAVTVKLKAVPAVAAPGATTVKCVAPLAGFTVSVAEFVLENDVPADVTPEIVTKYCVGDETEIEEGMRNVTRRVVPMIEVTAEGDVCTALPPLDGVRVTVTLEGLMAPEGKPEPVTLITVVPGEPADGDADGLRVTCAWAEAAPSSSAAITTRKADRHAWVRMSEPPRFRGPRYSTEHTNARRSVSPY